MSHGHIALKKNTAQDGILGLTNALIILQKINDGVQCSDGNGKQKSVSLY